MFTPSAPASGTLALVRVAVRALVWRIALTSRDMPVIAFRRRSRAVCGRCMTGPRRRASKQLRNSLRNVEKGRVGSRERSL